MFIARQRRNHAPDANGNSSPCIGLIETERVAPSLVHREPTAVSMRRYPARSCGCSHWTSTELPVWRDDHYLEVVSPSAGNRPLLT